MLAESRQRDLRRYGALLHGAGLAVAAVLCLGYFLAVRQPLLSARAEIDRRIADSRRQLDKADLIRQQHAKLNDSLRESERLADLVRRSIPQQPQTPQFLGAITTMAEQQEMSIRDFAVGEVFERDTHHEVAVSFASTGDYASICRFIDQLAQMPRVVTFQRVSVESEVDEGVHQIQLSLLLPFGIKTVQPGEEESADG